MFSFFAKDEWSVAFQKRRKFLSTPPAFGLQLSSPKVNKGNPFSVSEQRFPLPSWPALHTRLLLFFFF